MPNVPIKVNFHVTAVVDPDDGLQPSDLTPETANVRVMILKVNKVRFMTYFSFLASFQGENIKFLPLFSLIRSQSRF